MTIKELIEELEYVYDKNLKVGFESEGVLHEIYQVDVIMLNNGEEVCQVG